MKKFTQNFSLKNIPFPSEYQFILSLTDKVVDFIYRIRLKTLYFYDVGMKNKDESFKFKSLKNPPSKKMLEKF